MSPSLSETNGPRLSWWQTTIIYEIYVRSFFDSNGDGVGDLQGIIEKLEYIKSLGVDCIWLTPIYPSGGKDGGYDVTSFVDIDPLYGSWSDFDKLVKRVHQNNMHIILDFVPNHTSNQHPWFVDSCKSNDEDNPYRDYYVWHPSTDRTNPPNNWLSVFGGPAWTFNETRNQWYFHQYLPEQPDLNFRCLAVRKEIQKIIEFWLDVKKVDGLRVDSAKHLVEDDEFKDEPVLNGEFLVPNNLNYSQLQHIHTTNQPETFELLVEWKMLIDQISARTKREKFIVAEVYEDETKTLMNYYQYKNRVCTNFTFNFQFIKLNECEEARNPAFAKETFKFKPLVLKSVMDPWIENLKDGFWTNWQIGNHDVARVGTRACHCNIDIANVLCLLLGGTATTYYGEEIGMLNLGLHDLSYDQCRDEYGRRYGPLYFKYYTRDYQRTPMQWTSAKHAGFTEEEAEPWLPVNRNYTKLSVENQLAPRRSHLNIYKELARLRREPSFQRGNFKYALITNELFSFMRKAENNPTYLVAINLANQAIEVDLSQSKYVSQVAQVVMFIPSTSDPDSAYDSYPINKYISTSSVALNPRNCLIIKY